MSKTDAGESELIVKGIAGQIIYGPMNFKDLGKKSFLIKVDLLISHETSNWPLMTRCSHLRPLTLLYYSFLVINIAFLLFAQYCCCNYAKSSDVE